MSNPQLNKLQLNKQINEKRHWCNFETSSNIVGDSNNEHNFPYKLLLTNKQVSKLRKAFANGSSANIKFQKLNCTKQDNHKDFQVDVYHH